MVPISERQEKPVVFMELLNMKSELMTEADSGSKGGHPSKCVIPPLSQRIRQGLDKGTKTEISMWNSLQFCTPCLLTERERN